MRWIIVTAVAAVPHAGYAFFADNHSWSVECNASGYVLISDHPVTRYFEAGAMSRIEQGIETIYLGNSCDAENTHLGAGTWCYANGGFVAEFDSRSIGFPRQEIHCGDTAADIPPCQC